MFGAGPFVFNPIQSKLVNPTNIEMNEFYGFSKNQDVLDRIPVMFLYVAAVMLAMEAVSLLMIRVYIFPFHHSLRFRYFHSDYLHFV